MNTISISKLNSLDDVFDIVKNEFSKVKKKLDTSQEEIYLSFDDLGLEIINLSALTMLTCVLFSIRKKYQLPFIGYFESQQKEIFYADPRKASFLKATKFINLTQKLRIIQWHLLKNIPDKEFNPNTGIQIVDVPSISKNVHLYYRENELLDKNILLLEILKNKGITEPEELELKYEEVKTDIKNDIKKFIFDDISNVFTDKEGKDLKFKVISYAAEIILNSFIHGRVNPFFAIQRTSKKITVTICDDGIGLVESFKRLHKKNITPSEALTKACTHRIHDSYGIFDVLISVLGIDKPSFVMSNTHHGFLTISDDTNILTVTRNNIKTLIEKPSELKIHNTRQHIRGVRISLDILIK
jgi:hypothetical protein